MSWRTDYDSWPYNGHREQAREDARYGHKDRDLYDPYDGDHKRAYAQEFDRETRRIEDNLREEREEKKRAERRAHERMMEQRRQEEYEIEQQREYERQMEEEPPVEEPLQSPEPPKAGEPCEGGKG
jgi:hypothetical protein